MKTESVIDYGMRGKQAVQSGMFVYVGLEERVPQDHFLRPIKLIADTALRAMDSDLDRLYSRQGRPSVPPEQLLKASLLQILFGIRSERQLVEHIEFNILYRWFLDLELDQRAWDATTFTQNRDRLLTSEVAKRFLATTVEIAQSKGFVSQEHFSVDGTLLQAWASSKSVAPIASTDEEEPPDPPCDAGSKPKAAKDMRKDFKGQKISNETHRSTTDPEAMLYRKADAAPTKPCYLANAMIENRNGLVVQGDVRKPVGEGGETGAALKMLGDHGGEDEITLGADKGYDTVDLVAALKINGVIPHIARNQYPGRSSAVSDEIAATEGYKMSIRFRKRIEQVFGWIKLAGCVRQVKVRGKEAVSALFHLCLVAYNLVRIPNIKEARA